MKPTTIIVADALSMFRAGVRSLLERQGFRVVEARSLLELIDATAEHHPDVALVDVVLPIDGGVAAVEQLRVVSGLYTIVWSLTPSSDVVLAAISSGAHGFLRKEISAHGLVRALRGVIRGEAPLSRDLAGLMIDALHGLDERTRARDRAALLSSREREVLDLVAQGARNRHIASQLTISEFTVKRHVQNILHKLDLPSRQDAATLYTAAFDAESEPQLVAQVL